MSNNMSVKKGDKVVVIAGRAQDKGKVGEILSIDTAKNRVVVQGINVRKFNQKPTMQNQKGSVVEREASIHRSNVMIHDPESNKGVRIRHKVLEDGKKIRVSHKSGESLDA